jgi:uncharacterized protein
MLTRRQTLIAVCLLGTLLARPGFAAAADDGKTMQRTVTITSTGLITAKPDQVAITVGVNGNAKTAKAALSANSTAMQLVISGLKSSGIEDRDIQTSNFSLQPSYVFSQDGKPPKLSGYDVANTVSIRLRTVGKLGEILDKVVGDGSNQVGGIQFIVSKSDELRDEARKAAVANATRIAKTYAAAAGVELGQVVSIGEPVVATEIMNNSPRTMARQADKGAAPPIESGEEVLSATVTVVWSIK